MFVYFGLQDEEDVKAIARLFADMGDSYVELIATGIKSYSLLVIVRGLSISYSSSRIPFVNLDIMYIVSRFRWVNDDSSCITWSCFTPWEWYSFNDVQFLAQSSGELDQKVILYYFLTVGRLSCKNKITW